MFLIKRDYKVLGEPFFVKLVDYGQENPNLISVGFSLILPIREDLSEYTIDHSCLSFNYLVRFTTLFITGIVELKCFTMLYGKPHLVTTEYVTRCGYYKAAVEVIMNKHVGNFVDDIARAKDIKEQQSRSNLLVDALEEFGIDVINAVS